MLTPPAQEPHPVLFDQLDGEAIRTAALKIEGAAGPSGVDANGWRRLCISFKAASSELCNSLALLARRICTTYVDPQGLAPLLASRLIAFDKCLGGCPIGVGETVRCIISKAILSIIGPDIQEAAGAVQLCAGHEAGCEAAVHAMRKIFLENETEAILQVDATNAFNSLNRQATFHNIHRLCPPFATVLINTYREHTELFIDGETILSREGTTQGDPLAMGMYALGTLPLIHELNSQTSCRHCKREGLIQLAGLTSFGSAWLLSAQKRLSRCLMFGIWLAAPTSTYHLHL